MPDGAQDVQILIADAKNDIRKEIDATEASILRRLSDCQTNHRRSARWYWGVILAFVLACMIPAMAGLVSWGRVSERLETLSSEIERLRNRLEPQPAGRTGRVQADDSEDGSKVERAARGGREKETE